MSMDCYEYIQSNGLNFFSVFLEEDFVWGQVDEERYVKKKRGDFNKYEDYQLALFRYVTTIPKEETYKPAG